MVRPSKTPTGSSSKSLEQLPAGTPALYEDPVVRTIDAVTLEGRLSYVVERVRRARFTQGITDTALATHWRVSPEYMQHLCQAAYKIVRQELTNEEYVTSTICASLERVIREALGPKGNRRNVIMAAKVWADIIGARTININHTKDDDLPDDPEELLKIAENLTNIARSKQAPIAELVERSYPESDPDKYIDKSYAELK